MRKKRSIAYRLFVRLPFWAIVISIALVTMLKWVPVWYTPVMLKYSVQYRKVEDYHTRQKWVPIEQMSPALIQAAIASEDNRFCEHKGFDWQEMERMLTQHQEKGKKIRGCSTISQQVAKNVFTFGTRTWVRKAAEVYWTFLIEKIWGKQRIMEVYLNVAETGKGRQACAIAASLPDPWDRSPDKNTSFLRKRRAQIYDLISTLKYPEWAL